MRVGLFNELSRIPLHGTSMKTVLLLLLALSTSLSAQSLWDKAQYGASRAALLRAYPDAVKSDSRGVTDANGSDFTFQREIGKYRYAVTLHMSNNTLSSVTMMPLSTPTMEMYSDMIYSIIAKYGGPMYQGDEQHHVTRWTIENKQVLARVEYAIVADLPWTMAMSVLYSLAKDGPQEKGC